jgi:hypothetical protein
LSIVLGESLIKTTVVLVVRQFWLALGPVSLDFDHQERQRSSMIPATNAKNSPPNKARRTIKPMMTQQEGLILSSFEGSASTQDA